MNYPQPHSLKLVFLGTSSGVVMKVINGLMCFLLFTSAFTENMYWSRCFNERPLLARYHVCTSVVYLRTSADPFRLQIWGGEISCVGLFFLCSCSCPMSCRWNMCRKSKPLGTKRMNANERKKLRAFIIPSAELWCAFNLAPCMHELSMTTKSRLTWQTLGSD